MPKEERSFDAFIVSKDYPNRLSWQQPHSFADTPKVWPEVFIPGEYEITYLVSSFNFPPVKASFSLLLEKDVHLTKFTLVDSEVLQSGRIRN